MTGRTESSGLRFYSIGIVVETKPDVTDIILVSPVEELSIQEDGLIKDQETEYTGDKESIHGPHFKTEHTSKNYVKAKWSSLGNGNRTTAPDVVVNETVILYKYDDVDEYFWDEIGREPSLRRLEDVLYSYSNVSDGIGSKEYNQDTSYWVRVSTKDKFVHIHTSDNDGEATTFDIRIDTSKGVARMWDGLGNFINWDAPAGTHEMNFNTRITRRAPQIIDESSFHHTTTDVYLNESSQTLTNISPEIKDLSDTYLSRATSSATTDSPNVNDLSDIYTNEASTSISNTAPSITDSSDNYLNDASGSITNQGPEISDFAESYTNKSDTIRNNVRDSIVSTAPAIVNEILNQDADYTEPVNDTIINKGPVILEQSTDKDNGAIISRGPVILHDVSEDEDEGDIEDYPSNVLINRAENILNLTKTEEGAIINKAGIFYDRAVLERPRTGWNPPPRIPVDRMDDDLLEELLEDLEKGFMYKISSVMINYNPKEEEDLWEDNFELPEILEEIEDIPNSLIYNLSTRHFNRAMDDVDGRIINVSPLIYTEATDRVYDLEERDYFKYLDNKVNADDIELPSILTRSKIHLIDTPSVDEGEIHFRAPSLLFENNYMFYGNDLPEPELEYITFRGDKIKFIVGDGEIKVTSDTEDGDTEILFETEEFMKIKAEAIDLDTESLTQSGEPIGGPVDDDDDDDDDGSVPGP